MASDEQKQPRRERLEPGGATAFERQLLMKPPARPNIEAMPRSSVFNRLQDFLPKLQAANQKLEQQLQTGEATPGDLDIENLEEGAEAPVIEMDLACGLFDIKDGSALAAAERAMDAGPLPAGGEGGGSDDSSDDSSDASEGPHNGGGGGEGEESGSGGESGEGGGGGCGRAGGGGSEAREGQGDVEMAEGQGGGAAAGGRAQAQTKEAVAAKRRKRLPLIQEV